MRAAGFSKSNIFGIINYVLGIDGTEAHKMCRWFKTKDNPPVSVVPPEEAVSFTLSSLASWVSTKGVPEAIMDLKAQITQITGEDDPLIVLKLSPSMMAEVQAAWRPYVVECQPSQTPGFRAIKQTTVLAPFSSPSKENEHENKNENGKKGESLSFSSPLRVAPQLTLTNSTERRVSHPPAPLPSLTSTSSPPPNLFPSQAYLLSFAHPSPSPVQISSVIFEFIAEQLEWLDKAMQRMLEEHASSIKAMIQDRNDKVLQAFAEQRAMYAAELEKEKAERVAEKAEREKADAALHEILAEREKASARLDVTREIIRLLKAELEAERNAKEELEAKNAELDEEIAEMKERITARKLKKKEAAI